MMLQNIYISNKCCSFELSINQRILKENQFHKNIKQLGISEGSCHSEDWSNDAENSALSQE